jgi:hypothetical protein
VRHRILRSPGNVEQVGQGVVQRRFAVAVSLSCIDPERLISQRQGALDVARRATGQR